jgi:hypothetical protein
MWANLDNSKPIMMLKQFQNTSSKYFENTINVSFLHSLGKEIRILPSTDIQIDHAREEGRKVINVFQIKICLLYEFNAKFIKGLFQRGLLASKKNKKNS